MRVGGGEGCTFMPDGCRVLINVWAIIHVRGHIYPPRFIWLHEAEKSVDWGQL